MTATLKRQWFEPCDQHQTVRIVGGRGARWVGTYWYPCAYRWHRHVFHDAHTEADVLAADEWCATPQRADGQLEFPQRARPERRVDWHVLDPVPSRRDHHYRDGRRVVV